MDFTGEGEGGAIGSTGRGGGAGEEDTAAGFDKESDFAASVVGLDDDIDESADFFDPGGGEATEYDGGGAGVAEGAGLSFLLNIQSV